MALADWLTGFGTLANVGSSVANTIMGYQNLNYQKWAQQQTWNREDNAVQRRATDLQNAGLSKTLAAGSAASTSTPIHTTAPEIKGLGDAALAALQGMQMKKAFAQTDAQIDLLKQQQKNAESQNGVIEQQKKSLELDNQIKQHDVDLMLDTGVSQDAPDGINPSLWQGISIGKKWWPTLKNWWNNFKNSWDHKPINGNQEAGFGNLFKFSPKMNDFINGKWNNLTGGVGAETAAGEDSKSIYSNWRLNSNERMQEFYMNQGKSHYGNRWY